MQRIGKYKYRHLIKKKKKKTQTNCKSKHKRTTNTNTRQIRCKNNVNSNIKTEINATNTHQTHTQGKCKRTARHTHFRQMVDRFSNASQKFLKPKLEKLSDQNTDWVPLIDQNQPDCNSFRRLPRSNERREIHRKYCDFRYVYFTYSIYDKYMVDYKT